MIFYQNFFLFFHRSIKAASKDALLLPHIETIEKFLPQSFVEKKGIKCFQVNPASPLKINLK